MTISTPLVRRLATSLIVVGVLAAWLGQPGPDRKVITVEFARAGLNVRPGDEVRVRGVPVGTIASIDIDEDAYIARYRLSADPDPPLAPPPPPSHVHKTPLGHTDVDI